MNHNAVVLTAKPPIIFSRPRKNTIPRRLPVTLWRTRSWIKAIVKLPERSNSLEEIQTIN